MTYDGIEVPKNIGTSFYIQGVTINPKYYTDPFKIIPERWLNQDKL